MKLNDDRVSKRTQILIHILRFNRKHKRPITILELEKVSGLSHATVSKSEDSLMDMALIEKQMFHTGHNSWSSGLVINPECKSFVESVEKSIRYDRIPKHI